MNTARGIISTAVAAIKGFGLAVCLLVYVSTGLRAALSGARALAPEAFAMPDHQANGTER